MGALESERLSTALPPRGSWGTYCSTAAHFLFECGPAQFATWRYSLNLRKDDPTLSDLRPELEMWPFTFDAQSHFPQTSNFPQELAE